MKLSSLCLLTEDVIIFIEVIIENLIDYFSLLLIDFILNNFTLFNKGSII